MALGAPSAAALSAVRSRLQTQTLRGGLSLKHQPWLLALIFCATQTASRFVPQRLGFPRSVFRDAARIYAASASITRMLAHFGVCDYTRERTQVIAAIANAEDAASLKVALGRPLLIVDSVDVDVHQIPLLTTRARFAADRVALALET